MKKLIFIFMCLSCFNAHAQNILNSSSNMMRNNDCVTMQSVDFSWAGKDGKNIYWDFSDIGNLEVNHNLNFSNDSLMTFQKIEDSDIYTYKLICNQLQQIKKENRLERINYDHPKIIMTYPFQYGDSVISNFSGSGCYCIDHKIKVSGQVKIMADSYGSLIISKNDTLNNVLRVYTITTTSIAMDMDSVNINSCNLKQEIEEKYDWYAKGYRYPLFETIQRTSYSDLMPVATKKYAYRLLPDSINIKDQENDSILRKEILEKEITNKQNEDIIHYKIQNNDNNVNIEYTLDKEASVVGIIADAMGIVYSNVKQNGKSGENFSMNFNCQGLHRGQYIIYINVNGKVYNEKISLK